MDHFNEAASFHIMLTTVRNYDDVMHIKGKRLPEKGQEGSDCGGPGMDWVDW